MTDYLSRLAARTLGLVPTVEAVLPSPFLGAPFGDDEATREVNHLSPLAAPHQPDSPPPVPAPAPLLTSPARPTLAQQSAPTRQVPVGPTPAASSLLERSDTTGLATNAAIRAAEVRPASPSDGARTSDAGAASQASRPLAAARASSATAPVADAEPASRRVQPDAAMGRPESLPAPLLPRSTSSEERPQHARLAPTQPSDATRAPIQISIGRIEVRATPTEPPRHPPRRRSAVAPAPDLSLQDYLAGAAGRSGGRP